MTAKRATARRRQPGKVPKKLSFKVMPLDVSEFLDNEEVTFAPGAHPKHETIAKVLKSLGVHFKVAANL